VTAATRPIGYDEASFEPLLAEAEAEGEAFLLRPEAARLYECLGFVAEAGEKQSHLPNPDGRPHRSGRVAQCGG
jgi:hypothetical protein